MTFTFKSDSLQNIQVHRYRWSSVRETNVFGTQHNGIGIN